MENMNMEITTSEHRAIVFKMNRKQAAAVARYLKEHSASPETIFAVDVDTMELIVQAKNAGEEDIIVLDGEEVVADAPLGLNLARRLRDVRVGPDGALYVLTDEDRGEVLRISN